MKALVKKKAKPGLWLDEVPEPSVGINDVLIRVDRAGICGTDLHIYKWDEWAQKTIPVPMVVGHEFVGEVVQAGSNVTDFFPGDVVSGEGHVVCGRCRNCLAGRRHLCNDTKGIGVNRPGAFAEYLALPMTNVWHHKHGVHRDVQQRLGMKEGFDVGLEMSGSPAALRDMIDNMSHGGKIAMLGIPSEPIAIDWNKVVFNMLTIKGIYGREMYETWYKMTVMLESGLDIRPVITHRFHYSEFEKGFEAMLSGQSGKVILDWKD